MPPTADQPLLDLLAALRDRDYRFTTITPASHARVLARPDRTLARDPAGIFGWSLPFRRETLDADLLRLAERAAILTADGDLLRSTLRVSTLHGQLFLHSAYPTEAEDAVFFGPDSYRFADLIARELPGCPPRARIVDIGTGAGVGAIVAAMHCPDAEVIMTDINPAALRLARVNAAFAGIAVHSVETDGLEDVDGPIDIALANPPYIVDAEGRAYRDGGGMHGGRISLDMAREAADLLAPGGRLILYTGSAIVDGRDPLRHALEGATRQAGCTLRYAEIDPDVFGEELEEPQYADVDRIALISAIVTRPA